MLGAWCDHFGLKLAGQVVHLPVERATNQGNEFRLLIGLSSVQDYPLSSARGERFERRDVVLDRAVR
jgi:hypothetical protein